MTKLSAVSVYRPTWLDAAGRRVPGPDEDAVTFAVAALRPLVAAGRSIDRIVVVTREPALLEGGSGAVISQALGLGEVVVSEVLGGGPAVVDQLAAAVDGTAVVGVHLGEQAGAGALLAGSDGAEVHTAGSSETSLPVRTRRPGSPEARVYDDPRLLRETVWKPALASLRGGDPSVAVGVPAALLRTSGYDAELSGAIDVGGAAAVAAALAVLAGDGGGRLVVLEQASARALDLAGSMDVLRSERAGRPLPELARDGEPDIPISLAAYGRAFDSKVGLLAGRCEQCGTLSSPPRYRCLGCGAEGAVPRTSLPRSGRIYSAITVRVPVPGLYWPYSLALVELDGVDVRLLVHVTDVPAGSAAIDDAGVLELRKVADRQGIPDYGYAFQPTEVPDLEVAQ